MENLTFYVVGSLKNHYPKCCLFIKHRTKRFESGRLRGHKVFIAVRYVAANFERKMLRRIFGTVYQTHLRWRLRLNQDHCELLDTSDIVRCTYIFQCRNSP
jgi:hypothetical protein